MNHRCASDPLAEYVPSCAGVDQVTCTLHAVKPLLASLHEGEEIFAGITLGDALAVLRMILRGVGLEKAGAHRTHDLHRGHALDLQLSGACRCACGAGMLCLSCSVQAPPWQKFSLLGNGARQRSCSTWTCAGWSAMLFCKRMLMKVTEMLRLSDCSCSRAVSPVLPIAHMASLARVCNGF